MKVGISNYKTGTKNNWRRTCWNEITKRVKNKNKATVLYLAAEQDLDRREAVRRGFRSNNLIAVDMRLEVVERLRKNNKIAVHGKIEHVAAAWGDVDVVYCDFCCGLTHDAAMGVSNLLLLPFIKDDCVFLFNFQRGRETKNASEWIKRTREHAEGPGKSIFLKNDKNRAQLAVQHTKSVFDYYMYSNSRSFDILEKSSGNFTAYMEMTTINEIPGSDLVISKANPFFVSYRSSAAKGLYFDTLIINKVLRRDYRKLSEDEVDLLRSKGAYHGDLIEPASRESVLNHENVLNTVWKESKGDIPKKEDSGFLGHLLEGVFECRPRVSAAKAVQTMRNSGQIPMASSF